MSINVTIDGLDTEIDVSLVPSATDINPESYVALRGLKGDKGDDGVVGRDGTDGQDGVGITSITQNQDGTLSINLDDGTSYLTEPLKGADGYTPIKGVDYFDGTNGQDGRDGVDGYTPVKGVDYFDGAKGETGATGATGATGNGIASAVLNSDYTLTLSFTDGTSYTTPSIRGEKGEQGDAGEVDTAMSGTSILPVQNRVIKAYVDNGLSVKADASSVPTKVSDLTNDAGYITSEGNTTYTLTKSGNTIKLTGSDGSTTSVTDANTTYSTMTQAQATAGTSTSGLRISPKVLHDTIKNALPTVPTKTSELTNDGSGENPFVTSDILSNYVQTGELADILATPNFYACDSASKAVLQQAFGISVDICVPEGVISHAMLLYLLEPRTWFAWMNGAEFEFARLGVSVNTATNAITLYLRGRTSIATGIMGVDSSWTVTPTPSVPTAVSELTNDSGYLTLADLPIYNGGVQ